MDSSFTTQVGSVEFYGMEHAGSYGEFPNVVHHAKAVVVWEVEMDYRSWGIKGGDIHVQSVKINWADDESDEFYQLTFPSAEGWKVIPSNGDLSRGIYPHRIEVDGKKKLIEIEF